MSQDHQDFPQTTPVAVNSALDIQKKQPSLWLILSIIIAIVAGLFLGGATLMVAAMSSDGCRDTACGIGVFLMMGFSAVMAVAPLAFVFLVKMLVDCKKPSQSWFVITGSLAIIVGAAVGGVASLVIGAMLDLNTDSDKYFIGLGVAILFAFVMVYGWARDRVTA